MSKSRFGSSAQSLRFERLEGRWMLAAGSAVPLLFEPIELYPQWLDASQGRELHSQSPSTANSAPLLHVEELWNATVAPYLLDDLWIDRYAYDAGHHLMVPLHAAFEFGSPQWQSDFTDHFSRLADHGLTELTTSRLSQFQYLTLVSRYLVLTAESETSPPPAGALSEFLYTRVRSAWETENADQWGQQFTGFRERLKFKLADTRPAYSYQLMIRDDELYLIAIAADLRAREIALGETTVDTDMLEEILAVARHIFEREIVYNETGGWVMQPGAVTDHPDFAYAAHASLAEGLEPAPRPGGVEDTAHFHRYPLVLNSLIGAHTGAARQLLIDVREGLARQFLGNVLTPPQPISTSI